MSPRRNRGSGWWGPLQLRGSRCTLITTVSIGGSEVARAHRSVPPLRRRRCPRRALFVRAQGAHGRLRRAERCRQDHCHAHRPGLAGTRHRRRPVGGPRSRRRSSPSSRLHAGRARPLSQDACARAIDLRCPAQRAGCRCCTLESESVDRTLWTAGARERQGRDAVTRQSTACSTRGGAGAQPRFAGSGRALLGPRSGGRRSHERRAER